MAKRNNGLKKLATIVSISIGALVLLGAIGGIFVERYRNEETCKRSIKNEQINNEQNEKIAEHETEIQVMDTKLDNIQKTVDGIDKKLDRALRR